MVGVERLQTIEKAQTQERIDRSRAAAVEAEKQRSERRANGELSNDVTPAASSDSEDELQEEVN